MDRQSRRLVWSSGYTGTGNRRRGTRGQGNRYRWQGSGGRGWVAGWDPTHTRTRDGMHWFPLAPGWPWLFWFPLPARARAIHAAHVGWLVVPLLFLVLAPCICPECRYGSGYAGTLLT